MDNELRMTRTDSNETTTPKKNFALKSLFSKKDECSKGTIDLPKSGDLLQLERCGGEFEMTDGERATLKQLVDISVGGVIIFTYPKANTPGCAAQACLFRDSYQELRHLGFSIYGLSRDTPKANLNFKLKNQLPFTLICNKDGSLITALGFKRAPNGTARGVIVLDKMGKVLASMSGTPNDTIRAVSNLMASMSLDQSQTEAEILNETAHVLQQNHAAVDPNLRQLAADIVVGMAGQVNRKAEKLDIMDNQWQCPW